jgi:hypothetical protein
MNARELTFFLQTLKSNCQLNLENFHKLKKVEMADADVFDLAVCEWIDREKGVMQSIDRMIGETQSVVTSRLLEKIGI